MDAESCKKGRIQEGKVYVTLKVEFTLRSCRIDENDQNGKVENRFVSIFQWKVNNVICRTFPGLHRDDKTLNSDRRGQLCFTLTSPPKRDHNSYFHIQTSQQLAEILRNEQ